MNSHRLDEAKVKLLDAVSRFDALVAEFPHNPTYRMDLAVALGPLARCCQFQKGLTEARTFLERSVSIYEQYEKRARHELRVNLADTAEVQLRVNDMDAALTSLKESLALPADKSWETHLRAAQLLAKCSQRPVGFDSNVGELAVAELQQSIEAGLPNLDEIESDGFAVLKELDSWKAIKPLLLENRPSPSE